MLDLPESAIDLKVWPSPKVKVQSGETPILDGGGFMASDGQVVNWSPFWHRRLLAGEIHLHDPRPGSTGTGTPPSLHNDVEVAQRRAKDADDARLAAEEAVSAANAAMARAELARAEALAAHAAAMKSSQSLTTKLADQSPDDDSAPTKEK